MKSRMSIKHAEPPLAKANGNKDKHMQFTIAVPFMGWLTIGYYWL